MYPFGSGQNQNPNPNYNNPAAPYPTPFGAGYPPMPGNNPTNPPYPQSQPPYPSSNAPYPQSSNPYPSQPSSGGYPSQSYYPNQNPGYPPAPGGGAPFGSSVPYPPSSGYPPNQTSAPYPSFGGGLGYPTQSSQPPQSGYPSAYPPAPTSQPSFGGYPSMPMGGGGCPLPPQNQSQYPGQQQMAGCFSEMKNQSYQLQSNVKPKGTPSVRPVQNFDATADAQTLRKAMKGFGTDEDALINVICSRSNEQRQLISRAYKTNFGKDLMEDIKSETSGNFENLLVALLTPIVDYYAKELHDAMSGAGTEEEVLIEILTTLSNYEVHTIKNAYERIYGKNLENEIMSETSGNFKRLLVSLCVGNRDESGMTDVVAAQRDATALLKAGELRVGTDESTFNMVLCQRNYQQLRLIFEEYTKMTGHTLEKAINKEFSGDIKDGLLAIVGSVSNKHEFFASRLKKSMAGMGTNDAQLIRVVVTRSEIDLLDVKAAFERLYGKSLKSWIKGDTSGHYKHALYALIGEERSK